MPEDQTEDLRRFAEDAGVIDEATARQMTQARKPMVVVPGGSVTISQSATELFGHVAPSQRLFLRDGQVCQLVERNNLLTLELLSSAAACSRFEEFVRFAQKKMTREGQEVVEPVVISKELAEKYLAAEARKVLPHIEAIINCPIIVERDGQLHVVQSGYDAATKLLVAKDISLHAVPLEEAVPALKSLVRDFHFQTPGDRSRALISLIIPALKFGGLIKGSIPADAAEADLSQSGKTYRQQIIAALYNDVCNVVNKQEGVGVGSLDEKFSAALVEGRPFIQFDNVRGKFSFQALESFMTAKGLFPARPAYSKVIHVDPSKFMIMISSNGYQTTPDLSNRSSIVRIFKRAGHLFKQWMSGGTSKGYMLEAVQDNQPYFLSCIFRVIRAWHEQGKPRTNDARHDFREWAQVCDWIVQNIFGEAPLMDGHVEAQQRVSSPDHTFLRAVAVTIAARNRLEQELKARDIFELCEESQIIVPGLTPEKRHDEDASNKVIGKIMARLFAVAEVVTVDAFEVHRQTSRDTSGTFSYPSKVYTFSRQQEAQPQGGVIPPDQPHS